MGSERKFVSRAGLKLEAALDSFGMCVAGMECADFGCNAGGFTDCLLQRGASKVAAIDTGYGMLDWGLRNDPRVEVRERTNVLHAAIPQARVQLVVLDMAWTRQRNSIPVALSWLRPGGRIVSLIKPHYEAQGDERRALVKGKLPAEVARAVVKRVLGEMESMGARVIADCPSPIEGGSGNIEHLVLLEPVAAG